MLGQVAPFSSNEVTLMALAIAIPGLCLAMVVPAMFQGCGREAGGRTAPNLWLAQKD